MPRFSACCTNFWVIDRSLFTYLRNVIVSLERLQHPWALYLQLQELNLAGLRIVHDFVKRT